MSQGQRALTRKARSNRGLPAWDIALVDQEPLREQVAAECSEAMARLERVRERWHHFERKDKPAFARWRAREFGALLSAARGGEKKIRDCQTLVHGGERGMR